MKKIVKNKKILICIVATLILIGLIVGGIFLLGKDKEEKTQNKEITNTYVAYVRINPLIKIEYSQTCKNENCSDPIVTEYELVNDDAKNIYKDIDLIGTNNKLYDVLNLISKTAEDNNVEFETVEIYSNWDNLNNYIDNNKDVHKWSYIINIRDKENLEDISSSLEENKILYNVEFETDGGSKINIQTVEKGNLVKQPTTPTKKGYKFIEWQLDGKTFDFNIEITSDITLKAKWEKIENSNNNSNKNENKQDNSSKTENKTKEISISNITINNSSDKYSYNLSKKENIKITITGKEDLINNINENNIKLYVDASGLNVGNHNIDIKISGINSNLTYTLNPKNVNIQITEKPKAYLYFEQLYSLENVKEIENKYNIKINLVADADCGYLEGGDGQPIESGKTYTAHINSLDPYVYGACGGYGEYVPPEDYECIDEQNEICATNLTKKAELLACAKQIKSIKDNMTAWVNAHGDYPKITDVPALSTYNLINYDINNQESFNCSTADGFGEFCYQIPIWCKTSEDTYNEIYTYVYYRK